MIHANNRQGHVYKRGKAYEEALVRIQSNEVSTEVTPSDLTPRISLTKHALHQQIIDLRVAGMSIPQIAKKLQLEDRVVRGVIARRIGTNFDQIRNNLNAITGIEYQRLEDLHRSFWAQARMGDKDAADLILKIATRRAKLLGIDSPEKSLGLIQHSGHIDVDHQIDVSNLPTEELEQLSRILSPVARMEDLPNSTKTESN